MNTPQNRTPRPSWTAPGLLRMGIVLFDLLIVTLAGWTLRQGYREHQRWAATTTLNLAQVLEQNLGGLVRQIDLALLAVKDEFERPGHPHSMEGLSEHLKVQFERIRVLNGFRYADAEGIIRLGSEVVPRSAVSIADRAYFQHLKAHPEAGLFITEPILGRTSGKWVVLFARRLNHPGGAFAGVVYATITVDNFTQDLSLVDVGPHGTISLRGSDLGLITRYPAVPGVERLIGNRTVTGSYLKAIQASSATSQFTETSVLDGTTRTYTLRRMGTPPFHILVGLATTDYLGPWRRQALAVSLAVAGLLALSALIAGTARRAWLRQQRDQARLARMEERYRLLAENAPDVIWTADPEGWLTYASPGRTGSPTLPPELSGDSSAGFALNGRLQEEIWTALSQVRSLPPGSQPFEQTALEFRHTPSEGPPLEAEVRVKVLWGPDGTLRGFQGVTRDVTQRNAADRELKRLLRQQEIILDNANVGLALLVDRRLAWFNRWVVETFQYSPEELTDQGIRMFYPSDETYRALGQAALPVLQRGDTFESTQELVRKDGQQLWIHYSGRALDPGDLGKGVLWILVDLSSRMAAEQALRESESRYQSLFDLSPEGISVARLGDGRILRVNHAWEALFGYAQEEALGRTTLELGLYAHPEDRQALYARLPEEGLLTSFTMELRHRGGHFMTVELAGRVMAIQGERVLICVLRDITERERLVQDLQRALDEVRALSGMLPICSWCKKVRDDSGYWNQIEAYIAEHSEARFTHGVCPDCAQRFLEG